MTHDELSDIVDGDVTTLRGVIEASIGVFFQRAHGYFACY